MFCKKCGKELPEDSLFCVKCGQNQKAEVVVNETKENKASVAWMWLGIGSFVAGIVLYCIFKNKYPDVAARLKKGAIIGGILTGVLIILCIIWYVLIYVFWFLIVAILAACGIAIGGTAATLLL